MKNRGDSLMANILPAVGGLFMTYLYNVVDGIFVGRGVGADALGAVNIGVPFITFAVAVAAMFPMGGATVTAIRMGRGDRDGANRAFMASVSMTLAASLLLTAAGMLFPQQIADLSGARGLGEGMRAMAAEYLFYYSAFSVPMLMSTCLSVFVRNDGSPGLAFAGMAVGAVANIYLDWLFIFPLSMGVRGAAIASGLGQVFAVGTLMIHFVRRSGSLRFTRVPPDRALMGKICRRGVPEAVSQLNTPVTALCYNIVLARVVGDLGVSTFSVLSFIYSLANAVLSGVAQGIQPLWGRAYGRRSEGEINSLLRRGLVIDAALAVCIIVLLIVFDRPVIGIFSGDAALTDAASAALPMFSLSFLPMALNLIFTALLFSTKRTSQADAIAVSRGIVCKALAVFAMPMIFGSGAVWLAPLAAELVTLALALVLTRRTKLAFM